MYISNNNLSFKSTIIPLNSKEPIHKYMDAMKCFNLTSLNKNSITDCYKLLFNQSKNEGLYRTGVRIEAGEQPCLRIFGYNLENDIAAFSALRKIDKNIKYKNDIPDDGYDHSTFQLLR